MKHSSSLPSKNKRTEGGFALIIILAAIVLLLALVVGFFSRVQSELQSSSTYQSTGSARNLSDYAVNLVLAQIKAGTRGQATDGSITAWASQPGAIRTFDTSGNLLSVYKLYSAQNMVVSSIDAAIEASALNNWASSRATFTDLNEPVGGQFPILDPSAKTVVKGFDIKTLPSGGGGNDAPMPARWLYILKDGQIVFPTGSGNTAGVTGANANNPIVGRIAFWTDDDSSKININTAGGGPWKEPNLNLTYRYGGSSTLTYTGPGFSSFWTTPVVFNKQEGALAATQPTQMEYQRYPGHPANTFLTAALPKLATADDIYSLLPRLQNQGSKGGTVQVDTAIKVRPDADRLYQSVDELVFRPTLAGTERQTNATVTKEDLEKAKFFLTANSRSPDVNMFNEPCISMWPITLNKNTPFDQLIAFCETIPSASAGGKAYYFTRSNPNSSTADLESSQPPFQRNKDIIAYLRKKTSERVPGFGGPQGILGKYGVDDRDQTLTQIFDYIRSTNPRDSSQAGTAYHYATTGAIVPIYDSSTNTKGFGRFPTITKIGLLIYGVGINQNDADQSTVIAAVDRETARAAFKLRVAAPDTTVPPTKGKMVMQAALIFEMFAPAQAYNIFNPECTIKVTGLQNFLWNGSPMFRDNEGTLQFRGGNGADWGNENISFMLGGRIGIRALGAVVTSRGIAYPFAGNLTSPEVDCWSGGTGTRPTFEFSGGGVTIDISSSSEKIQTIIANLDRATLPVPDLAPYVRGGDAGAADFCKISERIQLAKSDEYINAWITDSDVVQTTNVGSGDFRIVAGLRDPAPSLFVAHPYYGTKMRAHNFFLSLPAAYYGAGLGAYNKPTASYKPVTTAYESLDGTLYRQRGNNWKKAAGTDDYNGTFSYSRDTYLADTYSIDGVKAGGGTSTVQGDFDNGVGRVGDGPYINFPDEGTTGKNGAIGYLGGVTGITELGPNFFTPNRMMSSAAMLGSLPTQVKSGKPWQTLLFRPSPAGHAGLNNPPDYLLLDFFKMPIVEPYAISEPLSTAGRVNMNYQILPYSYFDRSTAIRAVLRSEQMLAIPDSDAVTYKAQTQATKVRYRYKVDITSEGTLKAFERRFSNNDIFRSPSEICSIWLAPDLDDNDETNDVAYDSMPAWWNNFVATGDNSKEASYARIYPRLTTKSNTYTVHYRVQALKKPKAGAQATWTEDVDKVQSEYRGSTTIERYIDPNDSKIPDYITASAPDSLDTFYKFRVLSQKQFNP